MDHSLKATRLATLVAVVMAVGCSTPVIEQPLQFSHDKHIENDIECGDCHQHFMTEEFSGMPDTELCMDCHEGETSENPEAQKLLAYAEEGEEVPWRRVYQLADHVFYSHRRHVAVAGLTCDGCHGAMAELTSPPSRPLVDQTMDWCLECHEERGATTDCVHCHR